MGSATVRLIGFASRPSHGKETVPAGQTIEQVVRSLGLSGRDSMIPMCNGRLAAWEYVLRDGDELELVHTIAGG